MANAKPWRYKYGLVVISIMLYRSKISIHLKIGYLKKIVTGFWGNLKSRFSIEFFELPGGIKIFSKIFVEEKFMLRLLFYLMFFPIILAFKLVGWIFSGILGVFKLIGLIDIFK